MIFSKVKYWNVFLAIHAYLVFATVINGFAQGSDAELLKSEGDAKPAHEIAKEYVSNVQSQLILNTEKIKGGDTKLAAAGVKISNYTVQDGLAYNTVFSVGVDSYDNLWAGTAGAGVSKFDGSSWTTYTKEDGVASDHVYAIERDLNGNIWFSTLEGVSRFNGQSWTTYKDDNGLSRNYSQCIAVDTQGNVWVGHDIYGLDKFNGSTWTNYSKANGLPDDNVKDIAVDPQGNIWIGTKYGGISKFDGSSWTNYSAVTNGLPSNTVRSLAADSKGNIWAGFGSSDGEGYSMFDGTKWTTLDDAPMAKTLAWDITVDKYDNIWVGTPGAGLYKYDGHEWSRFTISDGMVNGAVKDIAVDSENALWLGTFGGGVSKLEGTPVIGVSTDSIHFSEIKVNNTAESSFTIYNSGLANLIINEISVENTLLSINDYPKTISPNDSIIITVHFNPIDYVNLSSEITITSNDAANPPPIVYVEANTSIPDIDINTAPISFGDVLVGSQSESSLTIYNKGTDELDVIALYLSNETNFQHEPFIGKIAPNKNQTIKIIFAPVSTGNHSSVLKVISNDPDKDTVAIAISGIGISASIKVSTSQLDFGEVYIDSVSKLMVMAINDGSANLVVSEVSVANPDIFSVEPKNFSATPGNGKYLTISFSPNFEQLYCDTVNIVSNASPVSIVLTGSGKQWTAFESSSGNITYKSGTQEFEVWVQLYAILLDPLVSIYVSEDKGVIFGDAIPCVKTDNNVYNALVPITLLEGESVKYYFEVTEAGGNKYYLPETAPQTTYTLLTAYDGDANDDGVTNIFDVLSLLSAYSGKDNTPERFDINKDGKFDIFDLLALLKALSAE